MQVGNQGSNGQANTKTLQIFRYLQTLHQVNNPVLSEIHSQPWLLWFHDFPDHPCIRRRVITDTPVEPENRPQGPGKQKEVSQPDEDFILKVRRPTLTDPPDPPRELAQWLLPGWQGIEGKVTERRTIIVLEGNAERTLHFDDDPQRRRLLNEWIKQRNKWVESEQPARSAKHIFDLFYALQTQIERETERLELVVGDGLLTWKLQNGSTIHHPILLLRVQLHFNPAIPEFTIIETGAASELYSALFRSIPDMRATTISRCREDLDQGNWHPLGDKETSLFFKRLITQLSPNGEFSETDTPGSIEKNIPSIVRRPVIFLRQRTLGFGNALNSILEDLPQRQDLPSALKNIVGIEPPPDKKSTDRTQGPTTYSPNGEDENVLLSKPANMEQLAIARKLETQGAVLVQGPPGTGKTHTIANILGHLLAQGKSVLVTSHTAKALKVLRDQVVEPLQPLCVSVLTDIDSNKQLEATVDAITERISTANADTLEREAAAFQQKRINLLHQLHKARQKFSEARYDEYRPIVWAGQEYSPAQAARLIKEKKETSSWIPGPIKQDEPLPLSFNELVELYRSNTMITPKDEKDMTSFLPEPGKLIAPLDFEQLVAEYTRLRQENAGYRRDLWQAKPQPQLGSSILTLQDRLVRAIEVLRDATMWRLAAIAAGREGGPRRQSWDDLIKEIEVVKQLASSTEPLLLKYDPFIPSDYLPNRLEKVLDSIVASLGSNGKIHAFQLMLHKGWKTLIEATRVNGRPPETGSDFLALQAMVRLATARNNLLYRWQRQMVPLGGPDIGVLGNQPERICIQYIPQLQLCLQWYVASWEPLEQELIQYGFLWNAFLSEMPINMAEYGDILRLREAVLEKLPRITAAQANRQALAINERKLLEIQRQLELIGQTAMQSETVQRTLRSARNLDPQAYRESFEHLVELHTRRQILQQRYALLAKLEKIAPAWAGAIRDRQGIHGRHDLPGNPGEAWLWRQLCDELERRGKTSLEELQAQIATLSSELQHITAELVERKAWAARVRHTSLAQRQALQGWKALIKKAGKGTGKRAPRLLAEARKLMPVCQTAIPVWIMPLSRVVENFDPQRNRFDVVIIDEASQADVMALIAIYMGQQVIVVGDHEQVSPTAVGQKADEVQNLIDEHLKGIPNAQLYDGKFSIYELAQTSYDPICLREHFRCVPAIIQFSNHLSYNGKIKPLRDASEVQRRPATVAYRVQSLPLRGHVNEEEAFTITSLLVAATEQPEYKEATFGVISMVGDEQALKIDELLRRYLSTTEYTRRHVLCGNAAQFQGDERDIIFLSMVDIPGEGPLPRRTDGADNIFRKRFNVAASRARDQLWVVHSVDPDTDLKPTDIRRRLIEHAKNPDALIKLLKTQEQRTESEFEKQVLRRLVQTGYRVIPQWPVGAYRIDLVVEGDGKRLAIECDGDRWHPKEKLEEDMNRQAILERLGWRFVRIRGSYFFREPDKALEPVFSRLQALQIPAEGMRSSQAKIDTLGNELKERIIRRAAELRREWRELQQELSAQVTSRGWKDDTGTNSKGKRPQLETPLHF